MSLPVAAITAAPTTSTTTAFCDLA